MFLRSSTFGCLIIYWIKDVYIEDNGHTSEMWQGQEGSALVEEVANDESTFDV